MNQDISSQFIQFRKQISSKIINSSNNNKNKFAKPEYSIDIFRKQLTDNITRLKAKSTICNINLNSQRNSQISQTNKSKYSFVQRQNETLKTLKTQLYYNSSKGKQSQLNQFQYPYTLRQLDCFEEQKEINQYSQRYQKIMNVEQGLYYSKLQAKLDHLSKQIGNQVDRQQNLLEIDNMIDNSKQINSKLKIEKHVDNLHFESKVLQIDILNIRSKLSRFINSNKD